MSLPGTVASAILPIVATAAVGVALGLGFDDPTVGPVFVAERAVPVAVTPVVLTFEVAAGSRAAGVSVPESAPASSSRRCRACRC